MPTQGLIEFELWSKGDWPRRDVVGESFNADAIRTLLPRQLPSGGQEVFGKAALIPDPTNPHDRNAVKVIVDGRHVGHLSREDAAVYQPVFTALAQRGLLPVTRARVWGSEYDRYVGTDRRGRDITKREFQGSVTIALDEWYLCVPINDAPRTAATMLPYGNAVQVRKEEDHQDVLRRYVSRHGQCWAYGTLHAITEQSGRTVKELVEIRIDDQRVGDLTPAMSAGYLPIVTQLGDLGRTTAVKVIVKGNQVKAEVVLHAQKAHELDADWISANLPSHRTAPTPQRAAQPLLSAATTAPPNQNAGEPSAPTAVRAAAPLPAEHAPVPPKPTRIVFVTPPGWPPPPSGWEPWPGWRPEPEWPPAPAGWNFWQLET